MEQLTVKQALEQGYEFYGFSGDGWQSMNDIKDYRPEEATGKECLFNKDPEPPFKTTAGSVKEILADRLSDDWDSET